MQTNLLILLFILIGYLFYRLKIQEERMRVMIAFVAGLFATSVKHSQVINEKQSTDLELFKDSYAYKGIINSIACYFEEDYWSQPFKKFILSKWDLFVDNHLANGGFDQIYKDFFIHLVKEQLEGESTLFSEKEKMKLGLLVKRIDDLDMKHRKDLKK